jgi:hypothetical protein
MCGLRFFPAFILSISMLSSGAPAFAQGSGQWVDGLFFCSGLADHTVLIDKNNIVQKRIPLVGQSPDIPAAFSKPTWAINHYWYGDRLFAFTNSREKREDGTSYERFCIAEYQEGEWQYLGDFKTDKENFMLSAIPCANGRFIFVNYSSDLWDNGRPDRSPFARASFHPGKAELRIDSPIDHGQDGLRPYMHMKSCFGLAWVTRKVVTGEYATLICTETGLYWIFSLEKASLVKAGNIFRDAKAEWVARGGLENAVLCVRPEIGGTVLVAAQDEDFVMTETDTIEDEVQELLSKKAFKTDQDMYDYYERRRRELAERNPFIVWYRIYPETGKVEKLAYPPEGGTVHREGGKNDVWRPMPDGSVQMGWRESMIKEQPEPDKKADAAVDAKEEKAESAAPPSKADAPPPQTDTGPKKTGAPAMHL